MKRYICNLFLWPALLSLAACGSVSTNDLQPTTGPAPQGKPSMIQVLPFDTQDCVWGLEISSADEAVLKGNFPDRMAGAFVEELGQVAASSKADSLASARGWVIQTRLKKVFLPDPSVATSKRTPRVECTVFVFDLARSSVQPFLTYDIVAKDVSVNPLSESVEPGKDNYLGAEAKESARLLAQSLKDYLKSRGW